MITFFIIYDNLNDAKYLANTIIKSNKNAKLVGLDSCLSKNSIKHCNNTLPHVIISTKELHEKISKIFKFDYYSIIIPQIDYLVTTEISKQIKKLTNEIKFFQKLDFFNFKRYTIGNLEKSNFNISLSGTQYLLDCIMYLHTNPHYNFKKMTIKDFYSLIAIKYQINTDIVIWNIHTAIKDMYKYTTNEYRLKTYGKEYGITISQIVEMYSNLY